MAKNQSKKTFSFNPSLNMSIDPKSGTEEVVPDIPTPQAATPLLDPTKRTVTPEASAITPESLTNETPLDVSFKQVPPEGTSTTVTPAAETPVDAMIANADQVIEDEKITKEEQQSGDITQKLFEAVGETRGESSDRAQADLAGQQERRELHAINSKIKALNAEIAQDDIQLINNQRNEEVRDTLLPFARSNQAKLAGDAAILRALKTSQKGVLVAEAYAKQGDITLAIDEANSAVDAKYAPYKEDIAIYTAQLEVLLPTLNAQEKKQAAALLRKNKLADDEIDRQAQTEKDIQSISFSAQKNGAPASLIDSLKDATNYFEAAQSLGHWLRTPTVAKASVAPTIKSINGVDMQWNPTTSQWETPSGSGGGEADAEKTQQTIDQLAFLRSTAKSATDLANSEGIFRTPVGPSLITKAIGATLIGNTSYDQMVAFTNTLKSNMLTLATDPDIKKFFGPQMSNADVLLMTSSGTTLNPDAQTTTQLKNEIVRMDDLFNRMETAVKLGQQGGNQVTAPSGEIIQIIPE